MASQDPHDDAGRRDSALARADASIRQAQDAMAAMLAGVGAPPPAAPRAAAERPAAPPTSGVTHETPSGGEKRAAPPRASARGGRLKRRLGGVAITLAFIPLGLVGSAALFGDGGNGGALGFGGDRSADAVTAGTFDIRKALAHPGRHVSVVARVPARHLQVYRRPSPKARHHRLQAARLDGKRLPLVLLVQRRKGRWLQVHLPTRPNLSTGWVRRGAVRLRANPYRMQVQLKRHRLTVWRGKHRIARAPIGVGKSLTPTPTGLYYVTNLIRPPEPGGTYGPYAFGLSGHSPVLTSFGGGDGQLGLHGTDRPGALGSDVSHGCIRVRNRVISRLAHTLPLGTPVAIKR